MKRLVFILSLICFAGTVSAQSEVPSDSIRFQPENHIQFGDFLIDMNLLKTPQLPQITHEFVFGPDISKNYNSIFQLDPKWTVTQGNMLYTSYPRFSSLGFSSGTEQLQISTFRLKNDTRITLYGQYNMDGYRVPDRSALPWDKNKFVGGMEVKFNNGFGIRLDVRRERNPYLP
ncbi:occludin [Bacteroides sp. 519]|uniref:occludin n=1 Tax=Bacteroides sp. 519 TaxID=2302937 RepID=UPI0013D2DA2E|nr:occludin [Bacteroides sp. 519]NDV60175.1 occludin [Bacteroides sp. 519]